MHPPQLSLLVAQVLDTVLVYLRPLLGDIIEELVLHVPLNDDLIVAGHGSATREFSPERLGRHLQVHVECAEAGDHCHGLLLAARRSEYRYLPLHVVPVLLIRFYVALAAPLLPLLVVRIGGLAVLHLDLLELRGQVLLQPALAFLEFGIVLAVLEGMGGIKTCGIEMFPEIRNRPKLTSIGIVQLPQYCTSTGYVTPSFGPTLRSTMATI